MIMFGGMPTMLIACVLSGMTLTCRWGVMACSWVQRFSCDTWWWVGVLIQYHPCAITRSCTFACTQTLLKSLDVLHPNTFASLHHVHQCCWWLKMLTTLALAGAWTLTMMMGCARYDIFGTLTGPCAHLYLPWIDSRIPGRSFICSKDLMLSMVSLSTVWSHVPSCLHTLTKPHAVQYWGLVRLNSMPICKYGISLLCAQSTCHDITSVFMNFDVLRCFSNLACDRSGGTGTIHAYNTYITVYSVRLLCMTKS